MTSTFFKKISTNKTLLGTIVFLILGLFTRFAFIDNPKEVVFDEFHFFHFVSEYEEGEYFFDIHPPLGKLILWANAQMHGLPEFIANEYTPTEVKYEHAKQNQEAVIQKIKNKQVLLKAQIKNAPPEQQELKKREYLIAKKDLKRSTEHLNSIKEKHKALYTIGAPYSKKLNITGIRSLPAFFGAALVALMFYFAYFLTSSYAISALIGFITLFSPAFLVESQYVLMDSLLMFFIVFGGLFSLKYYKNPSWKNWIIVMLSSAIVLSIKWTGASLIGLAGIIWITTIFQQKLTFGKWISQFIAFWIFVPIFYMGTFAAHFALLPNSGEGDAFHTPEFRANLENTPENTNTNITPKTFFLNTKTHNNNILKIKIDEENEEAILITNSLSKNLNYKKIAHQSKDGYIACLNRKNKKISEETNKKQCIFYLDENNNKILDWENWLFYGKFIELNRQMGERSAAIRDEHPFASRPSDWIHGGKSIYMWNKEHKQEPTGFIATTWNKYIGENFTKPDNFQDKYVQQLHLFTNSVLWSILPYSTVFITLLTLLLFTISFLQNNNKQENTKKLLNTNYISFQILIIIMSVINIIPFVLIERPQFLYHAFEGVLFGILGLAMAINSLYLIPCKKETISNILWGITTFITVLLFVFFIIELPLIYGFPFHDSMAQTMFKLF